MKESTHKKNQCNWLVLIDQKVSGLKVGEVNKFSKDKLSNNEVNHNKTTILLAYNLK